MSAPVRLEDEAFCDHRIEYLGTLAGYNRFEALGRMAHLWRTCTNKQTYFVTEATVAACLGERGVDALIGAELGERTPAGIRVRGTEGRIEWLAARRSAAKSGGEAKARNSAAKRLPKEDDSLPNDESGCQTATKQEPNDSQEAEIGCPLTIAIAKEEEREISVAGSLASDIGVARRGLVQEIWKLHLALFAMLKSEGFDSDRSGPRGFGDAGEGELAARVAEMFREFADGNPVVASRDRCLLVLSIAGAEARKSKSLEWLDGGLWKANRLGNLLRKKLSSFPLATRRRFPWTTEAVATEPTKPATRWVLHNGERIEVDA